jgi:hypothetical protein
MSSIYQYQRRYGGTVILANIPLADLIVTRPWIHPEKVRKYRGYTGTRLPLGVVRTGDGLLYLIDGHHKACADHRDQMQSSPARLLVGAAHDLEKRLVRRNHGTIASLALEGQSVPSTRQLPLFSR